MNISETLEAGSRNKHPESATDGAGQLPGFLVQSSVGTLMHQISQIAIPLASYITPVMVLVHVTLTGHWSQAHSLTRSS